MNAPNCECPFTHAPYRGVKVLIEHKGGDYKMTVLEGPLEGRTLRRGYRKVPTKNQTRLAKFLYQALLDKTTKNGTHPGKR